MYTTAALLDLHTRAHQSLKGLLAHCAEFSEQDLSREFEGFGLPSMRMQLDHLIGAEQYWVGIFDGQMLADDNPEDHESLAALSAFRDRVATATADYLAGATDTEVNTRRTMTTWGGNEKDLIPAHVILRTQTHLYQHTGQITAMCRLLGRPVPSGLDFPLG